MEKCTFLMCVYIPYGTCTEEYTWPYITIAYVPLLTYFYMYMYFASK